MLGPVGFVNTVDTGLERHLSELITPRRPRPNRRPPAQPPRTVTPGCTGSSGPVNVWRQVRVGDRPYQHLMSSQRPAGHVRCGRRVGQTCARGFERVRDAAMKPRPTSRLAPAAISVVSGPPPVVGSSPAAPVGDTSWSAAGGGGDTSSPAGGGGVSEAGG